MKIVADVTVALDLALLILIWLPGAIYIIVNLDTACFDVEFILHFIILLHFALGMSIAGVSSEIEKEEEEYKEKFHEHFMSGSASTPTISMVNPTPPPLQYVSYRVYSPLPWIFTSIISLGGDAVLFAAAIRVYRLGIVDECQTSRIAHIAYDTVALALSLVSVIWFVLFAIYVIAPQRRSERLAAARVTLMINRGIPLPVQRVLQSQHPRC